MKTNKEAKVRIGVTCVVCGNPIPDAKGRRIYCETCRKEIEKRNRRNHRMLNQNDKNYKDIVGDLKNEQKTGSYMSISQVVKAAKKEGLTYGQYVIKYHV